MSTCSSMSASLPGVDVLRSSVELAQAKQTLIEARNTYDLAMANLNNIIGLPLDTELQIKQDLDSSSYAETLQNCVAAALRQRPELKQYDDALKIAKEGINRCQIRLSADGVGRVSGRLVRFQLSRQRQLQLDGLSDNQLDFYGCRPYRRQDQTVAGPATIRPKSSSGRWWIPCSLTCAQPI